MPDITVFITMIDAVWGRRQVLRNRSNTWVCVIGRKKPNVTSDQVRAALEPPYLRASEDALASQRSRYFAETRKELAGMRFEVRAAARGGLSHVRDKLANPLLLLVVTAGVLLLIACTNVATLLLARANGRRREIGVRLALGAGRGRLVRQLLTESLVLSALGGAAGLALALWAGPALAFWLSGPAGFETPAFHPAGFETLEFRPDWQMLAFGVLVSLLTGALFGLAPAWRASQQNLTLAMRGSAAADGRQLRRWTAGPVLVAGQLALSLPLLAAAALFVRSLENLQHVAPGHRREGLLLFSVEPYLAGYRGPRLQSFYREVLSRVEAIPGVVSATFSEDAMGRLGGLCWVEVPGREAPSDAGRNVVGPGFATTMGMTMLDGRELGPQDSGTSSPVAVVNESLARHHFGEESPIGKKISILLGQREDIREIVGVVKDARDRGVRQPPGGVIYVPYSQVTARQMTFAIRTAVEPASLIGQVRQQARELDPTVPVTRMKTMQAQIEESLGRERLVAALASCFGGLAVLLACVGLYGVLSYTVAQKTKEFGVRMALGARHGDIAWLVLRQMLVVLGAGLPLGIGAALASGRLVAPMLYGLKPADPATLAGVTLLLSLIAVIAGYLPARRATRVDPLEALRHE
jgi:predicted permease